jgi:hypothetical protein
MQSSDLMNDDGYYDVTDRFLAWRYTCMAGETGVLCACSINEKFFGLLHGLCD